jgi:hypothetical protein
MIRNTLTPILFLVAALLAACTPPAAPVSTTDPYAYCQKIQNVDTPGPQYTGPKMPQSLALALKKASGAAEDAPLEMFIQASSWRCMDGKVYACFVGANLPCSAKANLDQTPTSAETDFCQANPQSDFIPAVVTGRETVFEWRCKNGKPETSRQLVQVDARGFIANIWYALPAP